jgi:hypothetical protein
VDSETPVWFREVVVEIPHNSGNPVGAFDGQSRVRFQVHGNSVRGVLSAFNGRKEPVWAFAHPLEQALKSGEVGSSAFLNS